MVTSKLDSRQLEEIRPADSLNPLTHTLEFACILGIDVHDIHYRFDYFGLMYLSPGLGMFSYTEGMYLLPDGRIAVTSDVDRPWVIERE